MRERKVFMGRVETRLLRAEEIECRIATLNEKGATLFLYKDARVDQKILDEVFGVFGWKRSHAQIGGEMFCTVEVWDDEKKEWIGKQDVGTPSNMEQVKGLVSDSFKRACFNLGIGRELYTAPFIWIPASKVNIEKRSNGSFYTNDRFSVKEISYGNEREIAGLTIVNSRGAVVYSLGNPDNWKGKPGRIDERQTAELEAQLRRTGIDIDKVLERYGIESIEAMEQDTYRKAIGSLKKTKTAA